MIITLLIKTDQSSQSVKTSVLYFLGENSVKTICGFNTVDLPKLFESKQLLDS